MYAGCCTYVFQPAVLLTEWIRCWLWYTQMTAARTNDLPRRGRGTARRRGGWGEILLFCTCYNNEKMCICSCCYRYFKREGLLLIRLFCIFDGTKIQKIHLPRRGRFSRAHITVISESLRQYRTIRGSCLDGTYAASNFRENMTASFPSFVTKIHA